MDARLNPERVSSMESQYCDCPCPDWTPTVYPLISLNLFHSQTQTGLCKSAVPVRTRNSTNAAASVWLGVGNTLRHYL